MLIRRVKTGGRRWRQRYQISTLTTLGCTWSLEHDLPCRRCGPTQLAPQLLLDSDAAWQPDLSFYTSRQYSAMNSAIGQRQGTRSFRPSYRLRRSGPSTLKGISFSCLTVAIHQFTHLGTTAANA
uniref:Uncharacterized protein n=1 Tax=Macrostomum lignano TaxID=282301 RepID=A0A1I8IY89_9PLAT